MVTSLPSLTETHIDRKENTTKMIELQENTNGFRSTPISTFEDHEYDVFLSFRGEDTRDGFTSILYENLNDAGLLVYKDDVELQAGEDILPTLMEAIEKSKLSILIFSSDYASSKSCLQEVAKVKECREKRQQIVLPIFYEIEPSDVRSQRGPFKKSFCQHRKKGVGTQLLDQWAKALLEIGFLKGYPVWPKVNQGKLVREIVSVVMERLRTSELPVRSNLVGMERPAQKVAEMLQVYSGDLWIVGISGMPGIGKTTLAKTVYNKIHRDFDSSSFISEIRKGDILSLQNLLISELTKRKFNRLNSYESNIKFISNRFKSMKVLIVLDDVEYLHDLKAFCVLLECFGSGSRIILTTRRPELLDEAKVESRYQVAALSKPDALKLFCWHAFREDSVEGDYRDLCAQIASSTGGIPLIIELVGSRLSNYRNRERERWKEVLTELRNCENEPLRSLLDTSYSLLREGHQKIFLDIACFLMGESNTIASYMWRACSFSPIDARDTLVGMSLLKIEENDKMSMSDPICEYGKNRVRGESPDLEKRSRLWIQEQALMVLKGKKGSGKIEALCLQFDNGMHECLTGMSRLTEVHDQVETSLTFGYLQRFLNFLQSFKNVPSSFTFSPFSSSWKRLEPLLFMPENFTSLSALRFLRLDRAKISGDFEYCLPNLRWLDWRNCPQFSQQVRNLYLEELVILDMSCSKVTNDWSGWNPITEKAKKLKVLLLTECNLLHEFPSFPKWRKLEMLNFDGCSLLRKIVIPSDTVQTLVYLNLKGCSHITKLPGDLSSMEALETLIIDGTSVKKISFGKKMKKLKELSACNCKKLETIDDSIGNVESLSNLSLDDSGIEMLPHSISSLSKLQTLSLRKCEEVTELPSTIECLTSLVKMDLSSTSIRELPPGVQYLSSLRELVMENTYLQRFPEAILKLKSLERIDFTDCVSMNGIIPEGITSLCSLKILKLSATKISSLPAAISRLSQLQVLDLYRCEELVLQDSMTWPRSLTFYRAGSHIPL